MQLKDYFTVLWRRKWILLTVATVTMFVVVLGTYLATPLYSASTKLRVASNFGDTTSYSRSTDIDRTLNTYIQMATSKPTLDELNRELGLAVMPKIDVAIIPNTELIMITAVDENPMIAVKAANTLGKILIAQNNGFYSTGGKTPLEILGENLNEVGIKLDQSKKNYEAIVAQAGRNPTNSVSIEDAKRTLDLNQELYANLQQQYTQARIQEELKANAISIAEPASLPKGASKPNKLLNYGLGLLVSLAGGLGLALLFENLDPRIFSTDQLETITAHHAIGRIPRIEMGGKNLLPTIERSACQEAFLQLKVNLDTTRKSVLIRSLLFTSASKGEGKTTIATGLAYVYGRSGIHTILVDCNLRSPQVHSIIRQSNHRGVSNFLQKTADLDKVIQPTNYSCVDVITSGPLPPNAAYLLGSPQMDQLLQQLSERYELILLDGPSMLGVTDASLLIPRCDGVVFVTRKNIVQKEHLQAAFRQLANLHADTIFLAINNEGRVDRSSYPYSSQKPRKENMVSDENLINRSWKDQGMMRQESHLPSEQILSANQANSTIPDRVAYYFWKRILDISVSAIALVVLSPLFLLIAMLVYLDSPGPAFFVQDRVGAERNKQGKRCSWQRTIFPCYKFRTMVHNADSSVHKAYIEALIHNDNEKLAAMQKGDTRILKLVDDPRVTRLGRILRKTSLDELPQFWNVLQGHMSLVGPRPSIPYEVSFYKPWYLRRFNAKPGITGLWQITARSGVDFEEMVRLDIEYVDHATFAKDLQILLKTPAVVLTCKGAV